MPDTPNVRPALGYEWATSWPGVLSVHADDCPVRDGEACTCGPLGYRASTHDPISGGRIVSPVMSNEAQAVAWRGDRTGRRVSVPDDGRAQAQADEQTQQGTAAYPPPAPPPYAQQEPQPYRPPTPPQETGAYTPPYVQQQTGPYTPPYAQQETAPYTPPYAQQETAPYTPPFDQQTAPYPPPLSPDATYQPGQETGAYNARPRQAGSGDTLEDFVEDFLEAAAEGRARDPRGRRYGEDAIDELDMVLHGHVVQELGDLELSSVRRWQVQALVNELADAGLATRRLRAMVAALRGLFAFAVEEHLVDLNPADRVLVPLDEDQRSETGADALPFTTADQLNAVDAASHGEPVVAERVIWQMLKVVTIAFVLIALVLAAESV